MFSLYFDFYEKVVWVAVLIMYFIAVACRKAPLRKRGWFGQPLPNPIAVILPIVFFTVMAAERKNVGDTVFYVISFNGFPGGNNPVTAELFFTAMFSFFQNLIRNLTDDAQWLIAFSAIMSIPIPFIILYKYSYPFEYSIYLFVAYGYLGGMMNGMRQYMAAAIVLCGTRYLFSEKKSGFIKYAIIIMLAWSMHNSALIMIPMYFVVRRRAFQLSSYFIVLGSVVATLAFDTFLPSFLGAVEDTSYSQYANNGWFTSGEEGGSNIGRVFLAAVPLIIAYFYRDRLKYLGLAGDVLINIGFMNAAISLIATNNWLFVRLTIYFMVYFMILVSLVIFVVVPPKDRTMYNAGVTLLIFLFYRTQSYLISCYESNYFFPGRKLFR